MPSVMWKLQEWQTLPILSMFLHTIYFMLVTFMVIRNPHLLGLYVVNGASESIGTTVKEGLLYTEFAYCILIIFCIVLCWAVMKLYSYCHEARKGSDEIVMTCQRKAQDDGELPRDHLPLAEVEWSIMEPQ